MPEMIDLTYLDIERLRAMSLELGRPLPSADTGRSSQTALLRDFLEAEPIGNTTGISASFDYAAWTPALFRDGQLVRIATAGGGMIRLLDYPWLSSVMESLPRMLKVSQRAELSALKQKRDAHQIAQQEVEQKVKEHQAQLKDLENWKMDELTDVVRELFGSSVRLKIVPGGATRGEMFVAACPQTNFLEPPALLSQRYGCDIDAPWHVLGMVNVAPSTQISSVLMPTGNAVEDMFERLALAVNRIHRVASAPDFPAFSLTPLAVWREMSA
jgi:hypothetical protein